MSDADIQATPPNPACDNTQYPRKGANTPLAPVKATWAPMYSVSRPLGANFVTHKLHAIEEPPVPIPANVAPIQTPIKLSALK